MKCMGYVVFRDGVDARIIFVDAYTTEEAKRRAHDQYGIHYRDIISAGYTGVDDGFVTEPLMKI